jgi:hypothetical protein
MLICLRVYVEWPKTRISWNQKNSGFSIYIGSTSSWTHWNDFVARTTSFVMETTSLAYTIGSIWMLSIT